MHASFCRTMVFLQQTQKIFMRDLAQDRRRHAAQSGLTRPWMIRESSAVQENMICRRGPPSCNGASPSGPVECGPHPASRSSSPNRRLAMVRVSEIAASPPGGFSHSPGGENPQTGERDRECPGSRSLIGVLSPRAPDQPGSVKHPIIRYQCSDFFSATWIRKSGSYGSYSSLKSP